MGARWRPQQDATLARLYESGVSLRQIAEQLQRSENAVTNRRQVLGIPDRRVPWSGPQDTVIVAATIAGLPASAVAIHLGLPADRVRRRRAQLVGARASSRRYSAEEDEAIRQLYRCDGDADPLTSRLERSAEAIRLRARALGVHRPVSRRRWTDAEDDALRYGYAAGLSCVQIAASYLPGRTVGAVGARAAKLGLANYARRWTDHDDRRLITMAAGGVPIDEASVQLVRTPEALRQRSRKLGLAPPASGAHPRAGERWSAEEDAVLRDRAGSNPASLARRLGRSDYAVRYRMQELGLLAPRGRTPHHPVPPASGLTPGQHAVAVRALGESDAARLLVAARHLRVSPGRLRREGERLSMSQKDRAA